MEVHIHRPGLLPGQQEILRCEAPETTGQIVVALRFVVQGRRQPGVQDLHHQEAQPGVVLQVREAAEEEDRIKKAALMFY